MSLQQLPYVVYLYIQLVQIKVPVSEFSQCSEYRYPSMYTILTHPHPILPTAPKHTVKSKLFCPLSTTTQ